MAHTASAHYPVLGQSNKVWSVPAAHRAPGPPPPPPAKHCCPSPNLVDAPSILQPPNHGTVNHSYSIVMRKTHSICEDRPNGPCQGHTTGWNLQKPWPATVIASSFLRFLPAAKRLVHSMTHCYLQQALLFLGATGTCQADLGRPLQHEVGPILFSPDRCYACRSMLGLISCLPCGTASHMFSCHDSRVCMKEAGGKRINQAPRQPRDELEPSRERPWQKRWSLGIYVPFVPSDHASFFPHHTQPHPPSTYKPCISNLLPPLV